MRKTRIEKLIEKFPLLTKEKLTELYVEQQKSLPMIHSEFGIDFKACTDLLRYYQIPVRTISQSRTTENGKRRILQGLKDKYGVDNPSQLEWVKEKKKRTFRKHYGVNNIWKSSEYYKWLEDYMLIHYGVSRISTNPWGWRGAGQKRKAERVSKLWAGRDKWWASLSDEERSAIMSKVCGANTFGSKIETAVGNALDRIHISYRRWVSIGNRNFDFKIDGCKILIEVNGDFWHANPSQYSADDVVHYPDGDRKVRDIWNNDSRKRLTAERNGYKLVVLWESDIKRMTNAELEKQLIKEILV